MASLKFVLGGLWNRVCEGLPLGAFLGTSCSQGECTVHGAPVCIGRRQTTNGRPRKRCSPTTGPLQA
eukprot:5425997-Alexandrium_andersonii.AAC.1